MLDNNTNRTYFEEDTELLYRSIPTTMLFQGTSTTLRAGDQLHCNTRNGFAGIKRGNEWLTKENWSPGSPNPDPSCFYPLQSGTSPDTVAQLAELIADVTNLLAQQVGSVENGHYIFEFR